MKLRQPRPMHEDADMSRVEVRPFEAADVPASGALLAERHRRHRKAHPLLSPRFETVETAQQEVAAAFAMENASGSVALRDGRVVGYLIAAPRPGWGPNVWVDSAGQATGEAETIRDLYAVAAARWVDEGWSAHYVLVPTDPELVDAWFRLGFGHQQTHALRPLPEAPADSGTVGIRRAEWADIPALAQLEVELRVHQQRSPTFSTLHFGTVEERIAAWEEDFDDPDYVTFVVEHDGAVIGLAIGCALDKSSSNAGLIRPDYAGFLNIAAVLPSARGRGVGRMLGQAVLDWSAEAGFDCVGTDWRTTNLLSSRAWPALGFVPTFFRLHRTIGY
jgi:GNAT superfamily N-acetyltransferase